MEISRFVDKLKSSAPSKEEFSRKGLPADFIDSFIRGYICLIRPNVKIEILSTDTLLMLLQQYDCSKVEIGLVSFGAEIVEEDDYYQIGMVEQDILSLNKILFSIEVLDYMEPSHVIWRCASNSNNFLEAMLVCAEFFTSRVLDSSLIGDEAYTLNKVNLCVEKAGGEEYIDFYKMLLGYFK